jgi:hypothetical protein
MIVPASAVVSSQETPLDRFVNVPAIDETARKQVGKRDDPKGYAARTSSCDVPRTDQSVVVFPDGNVVW